MSSNKQKLQLQNSQREIDLQNQLAAANEGLWQIHIVLEQLKELTQPGGQLNNRLYWALQVMDSLKYLQAMNQTLMAFKNLSTNTNKCD